MAESAVRAADLARLVVASRPLSWINTAFPFAAAMVLSGRLDAVLVVGTIFFLVPYNFAMYGINDVFDYPSDVRNPRKGGVEGALLPPRSHRAVLWAAALVCAPFVVALVVLGTAASTVALAVSLVAVVGYSVPPLRTKERPGLDSLTSSVHFVSPAVVGLAMAGATWDLRLVLVLVAFGLWGMGSHAFGAVQDVLPDREGGIASIATALGAARTVRLAIGLWAAAGIAVLPVGLPGALAGLLAIPYIVAAWPYRGVTDAESARARGGWAKFLWINYAAGFVVTMLFIWWWLAR